MTLEQKLKRAARSRRYYWRHREKLLVKARLYYAANREEIKAANAAYKQAFGKSTKWYRAARKAKERQRQIKNLRVAQYVHEVAA